MNAVTCLTWIKRGIAKEHPDTVKLTDEELSKLMQSSGKSKPNDSDNAESDEEGNEGTSGIATSKSDNEVDTFETKYNLDHYDDDDDDNLDNGVLSMAGLSFYESNQQDPYLKRSDMDSDDENDETIQPDDNLIVLGKVHGDYFSLEVWVSNASDGSLYCHHDAVLSNCPLAIEWVGFDSGDENPLSGNLVAVGSMTPDIELWDIDVVNTLEPAFVLKGEHKKKKKHSAGGKKLKCSPGHRDAVLGLSWNQNRQCVLASASADESVGIWDLISGAGVSFFRSHGDKVQTVQWHPMEDQLLLSGCYDGCVRLFDCRTSSGDPSKSWSLGGEIEKVLWNRHDPFHAFVGTDSGTLVYVDVRHASPVYTFSAHASALTSLATSPSVVDCLVTASNDRSLKIWDVGRASASSPPVLVVERRCKIGAIYCAATCPDETLVVCIGGEREMKVVNVQKDSKFSDRFIDPVNAEASGAESAHVATGAFINEQCAVQAAADETRELAKLKKNRKKKSKVAKSKRL